MVPKSRLDEVLQKQKALQKQLEDMKKAQEPAENAPDPYDFDAKEREYMNLVLDGKAQPGRGQVASGDPKRRKSSA